MNVEPQLHADFVFNLGLSVRATNVLNRAGVNSAAQLLTFDRERLLKMPNCGRKTAEEIMQVVARYNPPVETTTEKQTVMSLSPAQEDTPVAYLRLSVRARNALETLKISTVGQLANVTDQELLKTQNFGKKSLREVRSKLASFMSREFVLWPADEHTPSDLDRRITRAARKLQKLKSASALHSNDLRFGHLIRELDVDAATLREAADLIVTRKRDPLNPKLLLKRLGEAYKIVRVASRMTLEEELFCVTDGCGDERDRKIIMSYFGWDGKKPRTLEEVGHQHRMTRERVRQICERLNTQQASKQFLPVLDCALKITTASAPAPAEEIENLLVKRSLTKTGFSVEGIYSAAQVLGREIRFSVERLHSHRFVVPRDSFDLLNKIDHIARGAVSHWGVATVEDIAARCNVKPIVTRKVLMALPDFKWLDDATGWFWISGVPRNSLLTQIRKILAVSPAIDVGELRTGVGRPHRRKGFAPPRRVLLELCRQLPWCRVAGEKISASEFLDPCEILSDTEKTIFRILKEHGPVMQRTRFEELCLNAGVNQHSFWIYLSYCPIITRYASGVYGLRGAEVPAWQVESLVPKRAARMKVLVDYGWTKERNIQIVYRVSAGMLSNGIVSVPAALRPFLPGGKYTLLTADNTAVGAIGIKGNAAWGLGPFFTRRGGETGDYLSVTFDLARRIAVAQIGDASLVDRIGIAVTAVASQSSVS